MISIKKRLLTIVISTIVISCSAQLTVEEVYNYSVGSVIQTKFNYHDPMSNRDSINTITILTKSYTTNNDTLVYSIKKTSQVSGYYIANSYSSYKDTTLTVKFGGLNNIIDFVFLAPTGCGFIYDSLKANSCNDTIWKKAVPYCGAKTETRYFVKNFGGPYYSYNNDATSFQSNQLIYYGDSVNGCGTFLIGISEKKTSNANVISIYPNPTNGILNIMSSETYSNIKICNVMGEIVRENIISGQQLDLNELESGVYFLQIHEQNKNVYYHKIILHK